MGLKDGVHWYNKMKCNCYVFLPYGVGRSGDVLWASSIIFFVSTKPCKSLFADHCIVTRVLLLQLPRAVHLLASFINMVLDM